jgi:hypothetical protein
LIAPIVVWLLQDMLQVLSMGFLLSPEFFLLVVAYRMVSGPLRQRTVSMWIWVAFAGGVLWDLRWASSAGMSGLVNAVAVLAVYLVWNRTPIAGRSVILFAAVAAAVHFLSGIAHYLAWATPSQVAVRMFLIQQLLSIPGLALLCAVYAFRKPETNV